MQALILLMIVAVTTFAFLGSKFGLPAYVNYVPELLSLLVAVYVIAIGVQNRFKFVKPIYWFVFGGLGLTLIFGAIVNQLQPGPMFAGIRYYLRALPFFFLPAVFLITSHQLRRQLVVLAIVCAVQLPIAWQQRMATVARGSTTGDDTFGTFMSHGMLSLIMIGAACVLTGFFIRGRISAWKFLPLLLLFLLPTTLNESKVTLVVLPIALLVTVYVGSEYGQRLKNFVFSIVILAGFTAIFIPVYDHFMKPRWGYGIVDFIMMEGRVEGYLSKGVEVGDTKEAGRLDGIVAAKRELYSDPARLAFGFGIGNASDSALGSQFTGAYYSVFALFPKTTLKLLLLEWGVLGLLLVLLLHWLIFRDSIAVSKQDQGLVSSIALGWAGVSAVTVIGIPYIEGIASTPYSYIYWYFSGLIVSSRMRLEIDRGTKIPRSSLIPDAESSVKDVKVHQQRI